MFTYAESLSHNTEREYSATVNEIGGRRQDMGEGLLLNQREPCAFGIMSQGNLEPSDVSFCKSIGDVCFSPKYQISLNWHAVW